MKKVIFVSALALFITMVGCKKSTTDNPVAPVNGARYTNNIKNAPVYLNLSSGDSVSVWDIMMDSHFNIHVNGGSSGGKGIKVAQLSTTMAASSHDTTGWAWMTDVNDSTLAIKDKWMNVGTYNPSTHSLSGYDTVTFALYYDAYSWYKVHFTFFNGSNAYVSFQYASSDSVSNGHVYWNATVHTDSVGMTQFNRLGVGNVTDNAWQFAMVTTYEFTGWPPAGIGFVKFPYGRLNRVTGAQAAWVNQTYDNVTSVPAGTTWGTDSDTLFVHRIFNYTTPNVLPNNMTLLVRQNGNTWKVSLDSYYDNQHTPGIVTWRYAQL